MTSIVEEIGFFGHPMIRATHPTTIEITKDEHLTPRGNCIIGVRAERGLSGLARGTKEALRRAGSRVTLTIEAPGGRFAFEARGNESLSFESDSEMVIRRSDFVCGRTLAILAGAAANQIPRKTVESLRSSEARGVLRIEVNA